MKKTLLFASALALSFGFGFAFKSIISTPNNSPENFKKATGIGGIFFKCNDPVKVKEWYSKHLGLVTDQYGTNFQWYQGADSTKKGSTQWAPFKSTTKYFLPSTSSFMINYRVDNLDKLYQQLKKDGVTITDTIETVEYGKFLHIMDLEGNKVELWEPIDDVYSKMLEAVTK